MSLPNGVDSLYDYDDAGRLTLLAHSTLTETLAGYDYSLDNIGNRRVLTESLVTAQSLGSGTYLEAAGLVVLEAENGQLTPGFIHQWLTATTQSGYTGTAYLQAIPDVDQLYQTSAITASPMATYSIHFNTPQTYTVWLRGYPANAAGDSVYVSLGETAVEVTGFAPESWRWARTDLTGAATTLPVETTGLQTVTLRMREDGLRIDRLLLTTDTNYVPTDFGPAETPRLGSQTVLTAPLTRTIVYTYDHLYRLTNADYTTGETYAYEYDPVGNRLEQIINGDTTPYLYDAANRLSQVDGQSYTFDDNGNLLNTGAMNNTFDAANRLIETHRDGEILEPIYNGIGHRVGQTTVTTTTHFALDIEGLPEVIYTSDGNAYLHLPGVIMAESSTGEIRYLLSDGLGSIRQVVDENGEVVAYNEFDPYGNPVENGSGPYGFTGEWWNSYIKLLHLRARWYLAETGTFLSKDPIESEPPYQYVRGDPVNVVDPSGLCPLGVPVCRGADGRPIDQYYRYGDPADPPLGLFDPNPWGPSDVIPRPPDPNKVDEYRRTQIMHYAERMAKFAANGNITDLEALARITEFAAKLYDPASRTEIQAFVDDLGLVIIGHAGPFAPFAVEGPFKQLPSPYSVYDREGLRDFGSIGFASELQDESNQLRHFWFAVVVEMCYPSEFNKLQGILHETPLLSGTPAGRSFQDVLLTFIGSDLGIELDNGTVRLIEADDWIRENLGPK